MEQREPRPGSEGWAEEVAAIVDPLLADVWTLAWETEDGEDGASKVPLLLRLAYLQGYRDALEEPARGTLYARLGIAVPPVKRPPAQKARRSRGSRSNSGS